ncbi:MAG: hypothetical protein WD512_14300, partial [Candidatus Paceibacterota bacterium]
LKELIGIALLPVIGIPFKRKSEAYAGLILVSIFLGLLELTNYPIALIYIAFATAIGTWGLSHKGSKIFSEPSLKSYRAPILGVITIFIFIYVKNGTSAFFEDEIFGIVVLFLVMPILNSIFDFFSIGITRYLGNKLLREFSKFKAVIYSALDLVIAISLLVIFSFVMAYSINRIDFIYHSVNNEWYFQSWNFENGHIGLDWNIKSVWIYLMMITTLIPTIIHFGAALSSLIFLQANYSKRNEWVDRLNEANSESVVLNAKEIREIINHLFIHRWLWVWLFVIATIVLLVIAFNDYLNAITYFINDILLTNFISKVD